MKLLFNPKHSHGYAQGRRSVSGGGVITIYQTANSGKLNKHNLGHV